MKKLLALAVVILGFTAVSFGQLTNTATGSATANILTALTIDKKTTLDFGTIGAKTNTTVVVMSTGGSRTAGSTADLIATGAGAVGTFEIKGDPSSLIGITFPSGVTNLAPVSGTAPAMTIDPVSWVAKIDAAADGKTGNIAASGITVLTVGATLNVGASQASGVYNGSYNVTVNYN